MGDNQISRRTFIENLASAAGPLLLTSCGRQPRQGSGDTGCSRLAGKRIRWIVPNELGGGYDIQSRLIAPFLAQALNAEIFVEALPAAGGVFGARAIRDAKPDGLTVGILNGGGFLVAVLVGDRKFPNPVSDFTVLCRVARSRDIWATGSRSAFRSMEDVFRESRRRAILFPTRDVGSSSFVGLTLTSHLLSIPVEIVAGYPGSRSAVLAALRGEVDLVNANFESLLGHIKSGDLRPLLQVGDERFSADPALEGVPLLGGPGGVAVARARFLKRDVVEAEADASAVAAVLGAGRLIVGPRGMDPALSSCLQATMDQVLALSPLQSAAAAANMTLDVAMGDQTSAELTAAMQKVDKFIPVLQAAIEKVRQ